MKSVIKFIEKKIKLKGNEKKSKMAKPSKRKFLVFSFLWGLIVRLRIALESIKRLKNKIKIITHPTRRIKFVNLIYELIVFFEGGKVILILLKQKVFLKNWINGFGIV
jgi:RNA-directed DNA polymerase